MIVLNEVKYAKECLENGVISENPYDILTLLARYYYHIESRRKKQIITLLEDYLAEYYPKFEQEKRIWQDIIENIASNAGKFPIHEIDGVTITKSEMRKIDAIKNKTLRKLAFTLLCLAKWGNLKNPNNNGWVNRKMREVFDLARVRVSIIGMDYKINELWQCGYLELPLKITAGNVRVTFVDDDSEPALVVTDFRELGLEYMMYHGGNYIRCANCGRIVKNNKYRNKLYCNDCATYTPIHTKIIQCVDCGKPVEIPARSARKIRCDKCQNEYRKATEKLRYERTKSDFPHSFLERN